VTRDKDERRLLLIKRDLDRIDLTVRSRSPDAFFKDEDVQDAIIQRIYRIADSTSELSAVLQERHPEIPWRKIADTRIVLAHIYSDLELPVLWRTVQDDLPQLRTMVEGELDLHRERSRGDSGGPPR
jgi:uncharacterized protein with HEPN domain